MKLALALVLVLVIAVLNPLFGPRSTDSVDGIRSSIARAGDVDADGVADLLVATRGGIRPERVWVLSGRDGNPIHCFEGDVSGDGFGRSLAGAGDVNGDGHDDVVVGAYDYHPYRGGHSGYAVVFSGRDGQRLYRLVSGTRDDEFGACVAGGSDVDGDGVADIAVGAPGSESEDERSVHLFSGKDGSGFRRLTSKEILGWPVAPDREFQIGMTGEFADMGFGWSVAFLPDLDSDEKAEVMIGSVGPEGWGVGVGAAYVLSCGQERRLFEFRSMREPTGWAVGTVGDADGDDTPDFFVTGEAYVVRIRSGVTGEVLHEYDYVGRDMRAEGSTLAALGDLDRDGHDDFAIGANETFSEKMNDSGFARIYSGGTGEKLWAFEPNDGVDVCGLDDVDGDDIPDMALAQRGKGQKVLVRSGVDFSTIWELETASLRAPGLQR